MGLIDSDYQGELMFQFGIVVKPLYFRPGERLAQYVLVPVVQAQFDIVSEFEATERGAGGFGHTGKN